MPPTSPQPTSSSSRLQPRSTTRADRISPPSSAPPRPIDGPAAKRLLTVNGVNINVAAGLVAAIGDIRRFSSLQKLVSYVGLNPRVRQSGLVWRSTAASASVVAAMRAPSWSRRPGLPPRRQARCVRFSCVSRRGHQVAAVAVARKLAVLCWNLLTKDADYQ
jgi:transposase